MIELQLSFLSQNPMLGQVPQPAVPINQEDLANLIEQMYGPRLQRINRPAKEFFLSSRTED
jgi:hypothetical protein